MKANGVCVGGVRVTVVGVFVDVFGVVISGVVMCGWRGSREKCSKGGECGCGGQGREGEAGGMIPNCDIVVCVCAVKVFSECSFSGTHHDVLGSTLFE